LLCDLCAFFATFAVKQNVLNRKERKEGAKVAKDFSDGFIRVLLRQLLAPDVREHLLGLQHLGLGGG